MLAAIWQGMREAGRPLSWRDMARAAGVGMQTLAHHFGRRDDVVAAVLADRRRAGEEALAVLAVPTGPFPASVRGALDHLRVGLERFEVADILGMGFAEGLGHGTLGPAMVRDSLEPTLTALEARLAAHAETGELRGDPRAAALALFSPLILGALHQGPLGGRSIRPLDTDAFLDAHAAAFVRGWGA